MEGIVEFLGSLGWIADPIGIFGAFVATIAATYSFKTRKALKKQEESQKAVIEVFLESAESGRTRQYEVCNIRRADLTRSEVNGYLGTIPLANGQLGRYSIADMITPAYFKELEKVQTDADVKRLTIRCTEAELDQFDQRALEELSAALSDRTSLPG